MKRGEEPSTRVLLTAIRWQDVTVEIADTAGEFARRYLKSHANVDTVDCLIAGTAKRLGARLLTQNVKHFPMFAGLAPAY